MGEGDEGRKPIALWRHVVDRAVDLVVLLAATGFGVAIFAGGMWWKHNIVMAGAGEILAFFSFRAFCQELLRRTPTRTEEEPWILRGSRSRSRCSPEAGRWPSCASGCDRGAAVTAMTVLGALLSVAVGAYLLVALLFPERLS